MSRRYLCGIGHHTEAAYTSAKGALDHAVDRIRDSKACERAGVEPMSLLANPVPRENDAPCVDGGEHDFIAVAVHVNYCRRRCTFCNLTEESSREKPGDPWTPWRTER